MSRRDRRAGSVVARAPLLENGSTCSVQSGPQREGSLAASVEVHVSGVPDHVWKPGAAGFERRREWAQ
jgi:hypothetical protein